jgi:hypothetical protein
MVVLLSIIFHVNNTHRKYNILAFIRAHGFLGPQLWSHLQLLFAPHNFRNFSIQYIHYSIH